MPNDWLKMFAFYRGVEKCVRDLFDARLLLLTLQTDEGYEMTVGVGEKIRFHRKPRGISCGKFSQD